MINQVEDELTARALRDDQLNLRRCFGKHLLPADNGGDRLGQQYPVFGQATVEEEEVDRPGEVDRATLPVGVMQQTRMVGLLIEVDQLWWAIARLRDQRQR